MKWIGIYLFGYFVLMVGILAALLKLGVLARIGTAWSVIAVVILMGIGIMISVSRRGTRQNIEVDTR